MTGPPKTMVTGLLRDPVWGVGQWTLSQNGVLVYAAGPLSGLPSTLVWVDRRGNIEPVSQEDRPYDRPRLSPDGRRIVYRAFDEALDVWVYDVARSTHTRLTLSSSSDADPVWYPDGKRIVFSSTKAGGVNLFWKWVDGSTEDEALVPHRQAWREPGDWTPDGRMLVFHELSLEGSDLWMFSVEDGSARPFLATPSSERYPRLSPDGRWIAYQSDESGRAEIHVTTFPRAGIVHTISNSGGRYLFWSKRGDEIYYQSLDGRQLMSVSIRAEPELEPDKPSVLLETPNLDIWDADVDGTRFLAVKRPELPRITELQVVFNWFEELKRLAPRDD